MAFHIVPFHALIQLTDLNKPLPQTEFALGGAQLLAKDIILQWTISMEA